MNEQEIFEFVIKELAKQGTKSVNSDESCRYRHRDKNYRIIKCAAGLLIPDKCYDLKMENTTIVGLLDSLEVFSEFATWLTENLWFKENIALINQLQRFHDSYCDWTSKESFKQSLKDFYPDINKVTMFKGLNLDFIETMEINIS